MDIHTALEDLQQEISDLLMILRHDITEAKVEIKRHHRDFKRISDIVHQYLNDDQGDPLLESTLVDAECLREIRKIVG